MVEKIRGLKDDKRERGRVEEGLFWNFALVSLTYLACVYFSQNVDWA